MTNGLDIYFWDVGRANKRLVHGFFSPIDLDNLLYMRQNQTPLNKAPINTDITDRTYQMEAIRRVCEAFEAGKRKADAGVKLPYQHPVLPEWSRGARHMETNTHGNQQFNKGVESRRSKGQKP